MAIIDRIASVFYDDSDDQAKAIIHAVSIEMEAVFSALVASAFFWGGAGPLALGLAVGFLLF